MDVSKVDEPGRVLKSAVIEWCRHVRCGGKQKMLQRMKSFLCRLIAIVGRRADPQCGPHPSGWHSFWYGNVVFAKVERLVVASSELKRFKFEGDYKLERVLAFAFGIRVAREFRLDMTGMA